MDTIYPEIKDEVKEMKKVFWALGLTMVFNIAGIAQKPQKSSAQTTDSQRTRQTKKSDPRSPAADTSLSTVSTIQAELQNTLDARKASIGDQVMLKITQSVKQNGEVVIPKGTNLIGRITEVQKRTKDGTPSKLGMVFDTLQRRELSTPISATIVSITDLRSVGTVGGVDSDLSGTGTTSTRTSSGGSGGGGLLGGVTNTAGGVINSATQTVGTVANSATGAVSGITQGAGTMLNGIQISSSASGSAQSSTTLTSQNNDVRLEKGVTFLLNVQKSGDN